MAKQTISLGTAPTGAGGDTPRSAFTKVQANFDELYSAFGGNTLPAVPVSKGGTGATTGTAALANLGGLQKGITNSNAQQTALGSSMPPNIAAISAAGHDRNVALQISNQSNNSASAVIGFIREGSFGCFLGLDNDNKFKIGGWSYGAVAREVYHQGNILGTCSQSGGVPTGSVIESGTNGNGWYIRYADGTQICRAITGSAIVAATQAPDGSYYSGVVTFTFPSAFTATPTVTNGVLSAGGYFASCATEGLTTSSTVSYRLTSPANGTTAYISYMAIGRWF